MNIRVTEDAADDLENIKERIARDDGHLGGARRKLAVQEHRHGDPIHTALR